MTGTAATPDRLPAGSIGQPAAPGRPFGSLPTWLPVAGYVGVIAILVLASAPGLTRLVFPAGALALAIFLFRRGPAPYVLFAWMVWHLSPGIRRIVDWQAGGWDATNPMSLTPFLVTWIAIFGIGARLRQLTTARLAPWLVAALVIGYGWVVGVVRVGPMPATHALITWLVPLILGLYLAVEWRRYPEIRAATRMAFLAGGGILAAYGILQFVNPPQWDRIWMVSSGMYSVGRAFPYEVRVFSLVNAPLPFATILAAGLLVLVGEKGLWRIPLLVLGSVALLLSLVRSVWLAAFLGFVVLLMYLPTRRTRRVFATIAVAAIGVLIAPLLAPRDIAEPTIRIVSDRFLTFVNLQTDVSFQDRTSFLDTVSGVVLDSPMGHGLGSTGVSSMLDGSGDGIRDFDNGVFAPLYSLGWFAGSALILAVLAAAAIALARREGPDDTVAKAARAVVFMSLALTLGANVFEGVSAAVMWGYLGLLNASHRWHVAVRRGEICA